MCSHNPLITLNFSQFLTQSNYQAATSKLWSRKLRNWPELQALRGERDRVFAALAATMNLNLEVQQSTASDLGITPDLQKALAHSGLLQFDDERERLSFPHL